MNLVDDATGISLAMMSEQETTEAAMRILWAWCSATAFRRRCAAI